MLNQHFKEMMAEDIQKQLFENSQKTVKNSWPPK